MEPAADLDRRIGVLAALDQPLRRDLYRLLRRAADWVGRDDAAEALGVPRSVAAFHLDKLVEAGIVEVRFERTSGRTGPGAGRPSKLYRPRADEVGASIPDRHYDLAGSMLASAIAESARTGTSARECLREVARHAGERIGREAAPTPSLLDILSTHGYEPREEADDQIVLTNCPFHRLAEEQRDLVCHMNLDFVEGVLTGVGSDLVARLEPTPGQCCVRLDTR